MPTVIVLFFDKIQYETSRNLCFSQGFDFIEEMIGGFDSILLFNASEFKYLTDFCDDNLISYSAFQNTREMH